MPWNKLAFAVLQDRITTLTHATSTVCAGPRRVGAARCPRLHRVGEVEDPGLAALLGAPPPGRGGERSPACPSEPSFSFPLLELLGSGCPVCVKTQNDYQAFRFSRSLFPSGSTAVQLCIRVSQPFVLGRCLGLFNSGVGGLRIKGLFTWIFLISVDWGGGRYLVLGSYKLYPKAKSKC